MNEFFKYAFLNYEMEKELQRKEENKMNKKQEFKYTVVDYRMFIIYETNNFEEALEKSWNNYYNIIVEDEQGNIEILEGDEEQRIGY